MSFKNAYEYLMNFQTQPSEEPQMSRATVTN